MSSQRQQKTKNKPLHTYEGKVYKAQLKFYARLHFKCMCLCKEVNGACGKGPGCGPNSSKACVCVCWVCRPNCLAVVSQQLQQQQLHFPTAAPSTLFLGPDCTRAYLMNRNLKHNCVGLAESACHVAHTFRHRFKMIYAGRFCGSQPLILVWKRHKVQI